VREGLGGWWYVVFAYMVAWEGALLFRYWRRIFFESPATDSEEPGSAGSSGDVRVFIWTLCFVAPAFVAGLYVVLDHMWPGQVWFPPV
jgi:hypothetical protein